MARRFQSLPFGLSVRLLRLPALMVLTAVEILIGAALAGSVTPSAVEAQPKCGVAIDKNCFKSGEPNVTVVQPGDEITCEITVTNNVLGAVPTNVQIYDNVVDCVLHGGNERPVPPENPIRQRFHAAARRS
jgi:hypothetical protein